MTPDGRFIVGQASFTSPTEAFRWTEAGGFEPLGDLPAGSSSSLAIDVSDDGSVIVGQGNSGVTEAKTRRHDPRDRHQHDEAGGDQGGVKAKAMRQPLHDGSDRRRTDNATTSSKAQMNMMAIAIAPP